MPTRKTTGDKNLIGQNVVRLRRARGMDQQSLLAQLQVHGIDISQASLSRLEGQQREASDKEVYALFHIFRLTDIEALFCPPAQ